MNFASARSMEIHRVTQSPKVDGILDDEIWKSCTVYREFTQSIPEPDKPSRFTSEVRMCYNDHSVFIAAYLEQPDSLCTKQCTARDMLNNVNADVFSVYLDTYNDHQNGFVFRVSSAGVQQDERLSEGMEYGDQGWDAVWNSKVHHAENGWHVEIEIPFSAIRFARQEKMTWGINFLRSVRKLNENSYWNRVDQQKSGFLAQTGELKGMENIVPPKRIFLFPYLSTGFLHQAPDGTVSNRWMRSGGLDIKYGLSESFTLDMTLVPDFSQVISDNLVRNLSPFEQQLAENRPFFTEGTELFNKAGIFYTRRIGARPSRYYTVQGKYGNTEQYEIEKNPNVTTLLNAFKISGRNKQKLGLGIFNAVGSPMYARITDKQSGDHIREETEPLTNYNVLVVDKGFKGQSNFNFTNTNLITADAERIANVSSFMWTQFNRKESYSLKTIARFSNTRNQTDQNGSAFGLVFSKVSGRFNFTLLTDRQSKYFDKSDMGIQFEYNNSSQYAGFSYNQNKPKAKRLQLYRLGLEHKLAENTIPFQFKYYEAKASCFLLFKSFWDITYSIESKPFAPVDFYQFSAWNKKLKTNPYIYNALDGSSDSRKKLFWGYYAGFGLSNYAHTEYLFTFQSLRYRVSPRFDLILSGEMTRDNGSVGYAYFDENLNEPLAGKRDVREYNGEFSVRYNLNPNTNLTARFRHYNSFIYYHSFHQVDEEGNWRNLIRPYQNGYNENFNLQNVDVFFNWMFRPGSRMVLSYKQWLNDAYLLNEQNENTYFHNLRTIVKKPHAYELSFRVIYFLDYYKLKHKA